jgi:hypothetical protein
MPAFAGFDVDIYPGDTVMNWLLANTNLAWCGYYLAPAPSHPESSWMGNRGNLQAAGWGVAPLYVGEQVIPPGSENPSAWKGTQDGNDAADTMNAEGFASGSCVYLDLEDGSLPAQLAAYTLAWCTAVDARQYQPGVYCSHVIAQRVHNLFPGAILWAFKVPKVEPAFANPFPTPNPVGSGYGGANAWQLAQNVPISVPAAPNGTLKVDLSSALVQDPGAPSDPTP